MLFPSANLIGENWQLIVLSVYIYLILRLNIFYIFNTYLYFHFCELFMFIAYLSTVILVIFLLIYRSLFL